MAYQSILKELGNLISEYDFENIFLKKSRDFAQNHFSVSNSIFKIAVIGESSSGKSSFVNTLLGQNISPTDILPGTTKFPIKFVHGDNKLHIIFTDNTEKILNIPLLGNLPQMISNSFNMEKVREIVCYIKNIPRRLIIYDTPPIDGNNCCLLYALVQEFDIIFITTNLAASPLSSTLTNFIKGLIKNGNFINIFAGTFADKFDHDELLRLNEYMVKKLKNFYETPQRMIFSASPPGNKPRIILSTNSRNLSFATLINEGISISLSKNYKLLLSAINSVVAELENINGKFQKHSFLLTPKIRPKLLQDLMTSLNGLKKTVSSYADKELVKFHSRLMKRMASYTSCSGLASFWTEKVPTEFAAFAKDFNINFSTGINKIMTLISRRELQTHKIKYVHDYFPGYIDFSFDFVNMDFSEISVRENNGDLSKLKASCLSTLQILLEDFRNAILEIIIVNIEQIKTFIFENMESSLDTINLGEVTRKCQREEKYARVLRHTLNLQKLVQLSLNKILEAAKSTKWVDYNDNAGI